MNILLLGPKNLVLLNFLRSYNDSVTQISEKISLGYIEKNDFDFLISYGYRYIISEIILNLFKDRAINLHISFLPFNRGADPNFWSFLENTPKGVTIHMLDKGVDTGKIIYQKEIFFTSKNESLLSSYEKLHQTILNLFFENGEKIKTKNFKLSKQIGTGSFHALKDIEQYLYLLKKDGWNTKVSKLKIEKK